MSHPLASSIPQVAWPALKAIPLVLVVGAVTVGGGWVRALSLYAGASVLLLAYIQNMSETADYGFAALVGNVAVYTLVGLLWLWEGLTARRNDFGPRHLPLWRYLVVPLALLAFWFPADEAIQPDFSLAQLVGNQAGLTLCMMLPVYLSLLVLYHPTVNAPLIRVTALAGTVTGLLNWLQWFVLVPQYWWMGVLHVPLVAISACALAMSLRQPSPAAAQARRPTGASTA